MTLMLPQQAVSHQEATSAVSTETDHKPIMTHYVAREPCSLRSSHSFMCCCCSRDPVCVCVCVCVCAADSLEGWVEGRGGTVEGGRDGCWHLEEISHSTQTNTKKSIILGHFSLESPPPLLSCCHLVLCPRVRVGWVLGENKEKGSTVEY